MKKALLEDCLTLKEVASQLRVHISTVHRWALRSVRGRRLKSHLIGGRRFVFLSDLNDFLHSSATTDSQVPQPDRQRRAQEQLRSFGVRVTEKKEPAK